MLDKFPDDSYLTDPDVSKLLAKTQKKTMNILYTVCGIYDKHAVTETLSEDDSIGESR